MKLVLLAALCSLAMAAAKKPNFVVFFADDMGYSQPGAMSDRSPFAGDNGTISTPHMDKLAAESMVFTSWYSAFHVCSPSRAAMMTGRLSVRAGIGFVGSGSNGVFTDEAVGCLPKNETTMAEAIKKLGYATGAVGKWHLGQKKECLPTNRGFDSYFGIPFSCDMGLSAWRYSNHSSPPFAARPLPLLNGTHVVEQPVNLATISNRYAVAALEFIGGAQAAAKPFLLYMPFNHVHSPNFAALDYCNSSVRGPVGDSTQELDNSIGKIMAGVKKMGLDESTVFFFTSDNGAPLSNDQYGNGPLRDGKTTTWEGGIREPACVRWKGTIRPGISGALTATYDIFPTVLSMAGASAPFVKSRSKSAVTIDGIDLTPLLMGKGKGHDCLIHYHSPQAGGDTASANSSGVAAVRCGSYKTHFFTHSSRCKVKGCKGPRGPLPCDDGDHMDAPVIFNLDVDISESVAIDVSTDAKAAAALKTCQAALKAHLAGVDSVPNQMISSGKNLGTPGNTGPCQPKVGTSARMCVGGNDIAGAVCKDPDSQKKFPHEAKCSSNPEYYGTAACRAAHGNRPINRPAGSLNCIALCMPKGKQGKADE